MYTTREQWLTAAVNTFRPWFSLINEPLPAKVRVSVGWGSRGARAENGVILGVTFRRDIATDNVSEIFISPEDADTASMVETVLHELIHVRDDCKSGHKGDFIKIAKAFGFTKPWTETPSSPELASALADVARDLGPYPGAKMVLPTARRPKFGDDPKLPMFVGGPISSGGNPQQNRHILCKCVTEACPTNGYQVRTTKRWLSDWGAPLCPFGHLMVVQ